MAARCSAFFIFVDFGQNANVFVKKIFLKNVKKGIDIWMWSWYNTTEKEAEQSPFSPCRIASMVQYLIFRRYSLPEIDFVVRRKNFFVLIFLEVFTY